MPYFNFLVSWVFRLSEGLVALVLLHSRSPGCGERTRPRIVTGKAFQVEHSSRDYTLVSVNVKSTLYRRYYGGQRLPFPAAVFHITKSREVVLGILNPYCRVRCYSGLRLFAIYKKTFLGLLSAYFRLLALAD